MSGSVVFVFWLVCNGNVHLHFLIDQSCNVALIGMLPV